jgi:hypothetical protein
MNPSVLVPAIVGAICGALGWLLVGLYMTGRQNARVAKNAGRAVYFELAMNRMSVGVALEYGAFTPLGRSSFDRLLPELATWLAPQELQTIVSAYMSHVGYRQASEDPGLPNDIRSQALSGILGAQERALGLLRARVFTEEEAQRMERAQQGDLTGLAHDDHGKTGANDGG